MSSSKNAFLSKLDQRLAKVKEEKESIRFMASLIGDYSEMSEDIAELIVKRTQNTPPQNRIPLLYVIDSVSKTCHPSFKSHFAPHIVELVLDTLSHVPDKAKKAILHTVDTWKISKTFPETIINTILSRTPRDPQVPIRLGVSAAGPKRGSKRSISEPTVEINPALWNYLVDGIKYLSGSSLGKGLNTARLEMIAKDAIRFFAEGKSPRLPLEALYKEIYNGLGFNLPILMKDHTFISFDAALKDLLAASGARVASQSIPRSRRTQPTRKFTISFDQDSLRRLNPEAIALLYEKMAQQCEFCGLRFPDSEMIANHLDWHFQYNLKLKDREKQGASRNWYPEELEWMQWTIDGENEIQNTVPSFVAESKVQIVEEQSAVYADEDQTSCPICAEKFDQFWDDHQDAWMYSDTMMANLRGAENQQIVHKNCFEDVGQS